MLPRRSFVLAYRKRQAMGDDLRGSATGERLACLRGRDRFRLSPVEGVARGLDAEKPSPACGSPRTGKSASSAVIASGLFEAIAADIARLNREIAARATPRPPFNEVLAASGAKFVAIRGWAL